MISSKAKKITYELYYLYGSSDDFLFGIHPENKNAVKTIVQATIEILEKKDISPEN